jgi:hypothetical protein
MLKQFKYIVLLLVCVCAQSVFAQQQQGNPQYPNQQGIIYRDTAKTRRPLSNDELMDTLRKHQDRKKDSTVLNSKFIKVTSERFLKDSTRLFPLDTALINFENYSPLNQPRDPRISLGNTGLSQRSLLFSPSRAIGFDAGLHELDAYFLTPQDLYYYRARVPYTQLSLVTGGLKEQIFKLLHTQNINPQLNMGLNANFIGSRGFYSSQYVLAQNVSDVNVAGFAWYESKNKRYNLLANLMYNNLKAPITGSIQDDSIFVTGSIDKTSQPVRLAASFESWKSTGFYLKQSYYIGRIDSVTKGKLTQSILPTQRVAYTFHYSSRVYEFLQNDIDTYHVFPDDYFASNRSRDSLTVQHLQNDFSYSFYLRKKGAKIAKNELKLDLGLTQDYYHYNQFVNDTTLNATGNKINTPVRMQNASFQDITIKGRLSYKLNDRISLDANIQQITVGRDFGDFLYDARLTLAGGQKAGRIIFEGYSQSSSPPLAYTSWISNHYIFHNTFKNQKTNSVSFNYINDELKLDLKAEYFLISDYLYFAAQTNGIDAHPVQQGSDISLLKVSFGKTIAWRKWHFDNFLVYQKSDNQTTLRTPEFYNYSSLYYKTLLFHVLYSNVGVNVRYNTAYVAPSYAPGLGQFYNGANVTYSSYPVATVFFKATLQRTNIFVMYDYANQGLFSPGFYTVNRYPQMDHLLKFGVSWAFYD